MFVAQVASGGQKRTTLSFLGRTPSLYDGGMKVIFTEGSLHHLRTMDMETAPQTGEKVVVDDKFWTVKSVTHLPKTNGVNDNENCCGWDEDQDADLTVHLKDDDE